MAAQPTVAATPRAAHRNGRLDDEALAQVGDRRHITIIVSQLGESSGARPTHRRPFSSTLGAPGEGFTAVNQSDRLLLDSVPVVSTLPWTERYVIGPRHGRYSIQWRTFLGDVVTKPADIPCAAADRAQLGTLTRNPRPWGLGATGY